MLNNIIDLVFQLVVVLLYQLESILFVTFQILVDFKNAANLFLLSSNNGSKNLDIVIVVSS
jgi:hypothetical protein